DVARLIETLRSGSDLEKTKAIDQLGAMGTKAALATQALCEAAANDEKEVSRAALTALEKVAPDLQEPVFTLLVDGQAKNHVKAIRTIQRLAKAGHPALPVILHQTNKCLRELESGGSAWDLPILIHVTSQLLTCLYYVAPESPEAVRVIGRAASFSPRGM